MLKKLLLAALALFLVLAGSLVLLMGYVFNNPDVVFRAFDSVTERFLQGQSHEENEEFFLQGLSEIIITSRRIEIDMRTHKGPTMKIRLHGKIPRFEQGPYILQTADADRLTIELQEPLASHWIEMNVNGQEMTQASDAQLKAEVYIPESYKKLVRVETREGKVSLHLPKDILYELDLQSVSGPIDNSLEQTADSSVEPSAVGRIQIKTVEGPIVVGPL